MESSRNEKEKKDHQSTQLSYKFTPLQEFKLFETAGIATGKYDEALIPGTLIFNLKWHLVNFLDCRTISAQKMNTNFSCKMT